MDKENLLKIKNDIKNQFKQQDNLDFSEFINLKSYDIIKSSGLFDVKFYFSKYPDVKLSNIDPIEHYLKLGVYESCNPNSNFDTQEYLNKYEDVKNSNLNPFVHYILYGIHENRVCSNPLAYLENKYFVSIIMPTFNRRNVISLAINSVFNQSFKNFELIIIDDGSDDGTDEFLQQKYGEYINSNKLKYFKLNHNGVCATRNFGLHEAKGNMFAYLDSDNQWNFKYLETMLKELDSNEDYNCAYCGVNVDNRFSNHKYVLSREFNRKKLVKGNFIDLNSFIHDRILYDIKGGFDENLTRLVDWDLIIRYTENNPPLYIKKNLVNYFIDEKYNNISLVEPLDDNTEKIHKKYWRELYSDEYEAIVDIFDYGFYLDTYDDVLKSGINPIYHFLSKGHEENRNPNSQFVTSFYKNKYPDVVKNNLNPLVHYAKWGVLEGREINYFNHVEKIINNNSFYLSNYDFDEEPLVSIIILNKNGLSYLKKLFNNFSDKTNYSNYEIIVVDNNSSDGSIEFLKNLNLPIRIIENKTNVSFSKGNNDAVKIANGDYILLLNNDLVPTHGWLNEMMGTIIFGDNVGVVGAKLIYPYLYGGNNTNSFSIQHFGDIFEENIGEYVYKPYNNKKYQSHIFDCSMLNNTKCVSVTGACLLTKKSIYNELEGFDENYWYGYEDVDFNLKVHSKGYDVILASSALLFHYESATRNNSTCSDNYEIFYNKWKDYLFRNLLIDKLEKQYFFTNKTLTFSLILNHTALQIPYFKKHVSNLIDNLNGQKYSCEVELNISNYDFDDQVDVLISFTGDYDINKINARKNIIKILVLDTINNVNFNGWDIIISNKHIADVADDCLKYYIKDFSKLNETIISSLYDLIK